MRLIHTSDWHLGRIFYKTHLIEDQAHALEQFIDVVKQERPDIVLVAGDVYDRSAPPVEAVELLDEVLSRIVLGLGVPMVLIAGNHDSPERIGFCSGLTAAKGLHLAGVPEAAHPVAICDEYGTVWVVPLPYAEPAVVRDRLSVAGAPGAADAADHDQSMAAQIAAAELVCPEAFAVGARRIAVAHALTYGGQTSESERPLTLGGSGVIDSARFDGFCYAALGHLHRPQPITGTACRYSGSLLKYSFDEADQPKSVSLVEIDGQGIARVAAIPLVPRHDVRRVSGSLDELIARAQHDPGRDDYLSVTLSDADAVWDGLGRLRDHYPNVMQLEPPKLDPCEVSGSRGLAGAGRDWGQISLEEQFREFYRQTTGADPDEEHMRAFREAAVGVDAE